MSSDPLSLCTYFFDIILLWNENVIMNYQQFLTVISRKMVKWFSRGQIGQLRGSFHSSDEFFENFTLRLSQKDLIRQAEARPTACIVNSILFVSIVPLFPILSLILLKIHWANPFAIRILDSTFHKIRRPKKFQHGRVPPLDFSEAKTKIFKFTWKPRGWVAALLDA